MWIACWWYSHTGELGRSGKSVTGCRLEWNSLISDPGCLSYSVSFVVQAHCCHNTRRLLCACCARTSQRLCEEDLSAREPFNKGSCAGSQKYIKETLQDRRLLSLKLFPCTTQETTFPAGFSIEYKQATSLPRLLLPLFPLLRSDSMGRQR